MDSEKGELPEEHALSVREMLADAVWAHDLESVVSGQYNTCVRAGLLAVWRKAAQDPDGQPEQWLGLGAPADLHDVVADRGIIPTVRDDMDGPCH